jgi:2-polyprenyl-3-methyl-5-hydroxy-6-metoxy-1,4-benzoquinol methylase
MENFEKYSQNRAQVYDGGVPEMVLDMLRDSAPQASVLDVGCGDGALLDALHDVRSDLQYRGVDLSEGRLNILRRARPYIDAKVDNAETLATVATASVDLLLSSQVLEHVDDAAMLSNVSRVLKPGGRAYISTVWKTKRAWYYHRAGNRWALDPTHVREYQNESEVRPLLEKSQLDWIRQARTQIAYPLIDPLVKKLTRGQRLPAWVNQVRKIRLPIWGYFLWELELKKI